MAISWRAVRKVKDSTSGGHLAAAQPAVLMASAGSGMWRMQRCHGMAGGMGCVARWWELPFMTTSTLMSVVVVYLGLHPGGGGVGACRGGSATGFVGLAIPWCNMCSAGCGCACTTLRIRCFVCCSQGWCMCGGGGGGRGLDRSCICAEPAAGQQVAGRHHMSPNWVAPTGWCSMDAGPPAVCDPLQGVCLRAGSCRKGVLPPPHPSCDASLYIQAPVLQAAAEQGAETPSAGDCSAVLRALTGC